MTADSVDMTEFARRVGVTRQRIGQLVGEGKLPVVVGPRKLIPWVEGLSAWRAHRAAAGGTLVEEAAPVASPVLSSQRPASAAEDNTVTFAMARARREAARARLAELDLAEREGDLIPVAEVRADAIAVLAAVRASLLALPGQLALKCEGKAAGEIECVLANHLNGLLAEWHQGRFA